MNTPIMDQSYQSYGGMDRPLFGETNKKETYIHYALGILTVVAVVAVVLTSFLYKLIVVHIIFGIVIIMVCVSNVVLIYWYREGDLQPKFRALIYYNSLVIILLCIVAFCIICRI
ncbi:transmembrane protein 243-like [Clytia hemisphaerica]|uniref:transmembrane protein 243-like n=1 Tax=Clytia hemisphaerica TaxID=252671 RepID=UPI0034D39E22|eukprot:TCONS_00035358-protein